MKPRLLALAAAVQVAVLLLPCDAPAFDLITNGLTAWYRLDGNGNDSSTNANHGTLHGTTATTDRFGALGALSFSGDNDYVVINDADLAFSASFSVSAWVRFDQFTTNIAGYGTARDIVRRGNYANYSLSLSSTASNMAAVGFGQTTGGWVNLDAQTTFKRGDWSLFTAVYNKSAGSLRLYVNGQLDAIRTGVSDPSTLDSTTTEIGNWYGTRIWEYPNFVGSIDDVLFYRRALSDSEVASLYDVPQTAEIVVEQPAGTNLTSGSSSVGFRAGHSLTFSVRNIGVSNLIGLALSKDGQDSADFELGPLGAINLVSGTSTTFNVTFIPSAAGARTATLHIASNDPDENPFDVTLTGQGLSTAEDTDNDGMNDMAELKLAALGFDWDVANTNLVHTLMSNASFSGLYTETDFRNVYVGAPLVGVSNGTAVLELQLLKSDDLENWTPFGDPVQWSEPASNKCFYRLFFKE